MTLRYVFLLMVFGVLLFAGCSNTPPRDTNMNDAGGSGHDTAAPSSGNAEPPSPDGFDLGIGDDTSSNDTLDADIDDLDSFDINDVLGTI
ncbi:MAG: hypothetical protein GXP63_04185 [DPANN group archaeon]|nr:hypothetical protein [DPANN group archaeon]